MRSRFSADLVHKVKETSETGGRRVYSSHWLANNSAKAARRHSIDGAEEIRVSFVLGNRSEKFIPQYTQANR